MQFLKKWYFLILCGFAITVYIAQKIGLPLPNLIANYLNDFLCMPIVFKICQYLIIYLKSDIKIKIPIPLQILLTLLYCIFF